MRLAIQTLVLVLVSSFGVLVATDLGPMPPAKIPPGGLKGDGHLHIPCPKVKVVSQITATGADAQGWPPKSRETTFNSAYTLQRLANPGPGYDTLECRYSMPYNPGATFVFQDFFRRDAPLTHPVCKLEYPPGFECRALRPGERYSGSF